MKKSVGDHVFEVANTLFCLIMIVLTLYPIVYVALASVSDSNRLLAHTGILLYPLGFNLDAYLEVFKKSHGVFGLFKLRVLCDHRYSSKYGSYDYGCVCFVTQAALDSKIY